MENLYDKITKKYGFVYKIQCDENIRYFYLGEMLFKECKSEHEICRYNEFIKAYEENQKELIKKYYNKIISYSESEKQYDSDFKNKMKKFINELNEDQYKDLERQVDLFSNLFRTYKN